MSNPYAFWFQLWQQQIKRSTDLVAWWAQFVPHQNAAALSAEAEAQHEVKPLVRSRREASAGREAKAG